MEQRVREKATRAVSDIFKTAGYDVHHAAPPLDLSAVLDDRYLVILCSDDREEALRFAETDYSVRVEKGDELCEKLLVTFNQEIDIDSCHVWYPQDFIQYSGETVLARVLGRKISLPLNGGNRQYTGEIRMENEESGGGIRIPHLPVRIGRDVAEDRAGIAGVVNLRFLPYWLFKFQSRGSSSFRDQVVSFEGAGTGALNAINGHLTDVDSDSITRREIPASSELVQPSISRDGAISRIGDYLIRSMTKEVRVRQVKGDAIFYEEKSLSPGHDNFSIEVRELYIPVWQIKGKKIVEINAHTGERLQEPMDDGVEVF